MLPDSKKVKVNITNEKLAKALGYTFDPNAECGHGYWSHKEAFNRPAFERGMIQGLPEFTTSVDIVLWEINSLNLRYSVADFGENEQIMACVYPRGGSHRNMYTAFSYHPAMALSAALGEYLRFMKKTKQLIKRKP